MISEKYEDVVKANILSSQAFTKAIFTGRQRRGNIAWIKVEIRPVLIKQTYKLQFLYYDNAQVITKNYSLEEAKAKLDEVIADGFKNIYIRMVESAIQIQITKKGKALIQRH